MTNDLSGYVFLMDCSDFSEAQVVRSFLISQGFNPRVRDEQTRSVAPHFGQLLGRLTLEIPGHEFVAASLALEAKEKPRPKLVIETFEGSTADIAKKSLWNAILGLFVLPVICSLYSMALGYRALRAEKPLTNLTRKRLLWAVLINSVSFIFWLSFAPHFFLK